MEIKKITHLIKYKMELDNKWIAKYDKAIDVIKSKMEDQLPKFKLVKENSERKTSYYFLVYNFNNITIELGGERGAIDFLLKIDDKSVNLYKEDKRFDELKTASENNFIIFIGLLKEDLEKNKLI